MRSIPAQASGMARAVLLARPVAIAPVGLVATAHILATVFILAPSLAPTSMITAIAVVGAILMFPLFGLSVLAANDAQQKSGKGRGRSSIDLGSGWRPIAMGLLVAYAVLSFFVLNRPEGEPEIRGRQYVLTEKGKVTEVITKEEYDQRTLRMIRFWTAHLMVFTAIAALTLTNGTPEEVVRRHQWRPAPPPQPTL